MSVNQWRYVRGTDEGCALYQCLMCYGQWEGRSEPGWYDDQDVYHVSWKFCPMCATEWAGQRRTAGSPWRDHQIGPRRQCIEAAIERRRKAESDAFYASGGYRPGRRYPGSPPNPPYWLVMEEAERGGPFSRASEELEWSPVCKMNGWNASSRKMLEYARQRLQQRKIDYRSYRDDDDELSRGYAPKELHVRVVVMRSVDQYEQMRTMSEVYNR